MFYLGQADKEYHNYNFDFYFQFCDEYNKTSTLCSKTFPQKLNFSSTLSMQTEKQLNISKLEIFATTSCSIIN